MRLRAPLSHIVKWVTLSVKRASDLAALNIAHEHRAERIQAEAIGTRPPRSPLGDG